MVIVYNGLFVDEQAKVKLLEIGNGNHLEKIMDVLHVTLYFRPTAERVYSNFWGSKAKLTVIGYTNNGENEGVLVSVDAENPFLQALFDEVKVPHITLSVSKTGKPVNTGKLVFKPTARPVTVNATFGAFDGEQYYGI